MHGKEYMSEIVDSRYRRIISMNRALNLVIIKCLHSFYFGRTFRLGSHTTVSLSIVLIRVCVKNSYSDRGTNAASICKLIVTI